VQGKDVVIFGDCEKQGAPDDLPISLYCYCLNTGSNIYLKLRPDNLYVGKKPLEVHGITGDMIRKHHHVPVKEGISSLVGWMNSQSNDLQSKIHFFAHAASVERNLILDNCAEADHSFLHTVEFHNTIPIFKNPSCSLTTTDPKVHLFPQWEQHQGHVLRLHLPSFWVWERTAQCRRRYNIFDSGDGHVLLVSVTASPL